MDFVNDKDLVAIARRSNRHAADDHIAHVVHAGIRSRVDFQHIHRATFGDFATRSAGGLIDDLAGRGSRPVRLMTIERPRDQTCGGGLADAARAGEKISVMQPSMLDRVAQCAGQNFLPRHIFEFLRAPLAGDYLIRHEMP